MSSRLIENPHKCLELLLAGSQDDWLLVCLPAFDLLGVWHAKHADEGARFTADEQSLMHSEQLIADLGTNSERSNTSVLINIDRLTTHPHDNVPIFEIVFIMSGYHNLIYRLGWRERRTWELGQGGSLKLDGIFETLKLSVPTIYICAFDWNNHGK